MSGGWNRRVPSKLIEKCGVKIEVFPAYTNRGEVFPAY